MTTNVRVHKTRRMRNLEADYGVPLEKLLPRLYEECGGNLTELAARLAVDYTTLRYWLALFKLRPGRVLVHDI